ncbi:ABC exporter membrane fusion protein [Lusitaniella coriacea]|uniref:ABC exporter membrane fusion protein n=1 Tax=Lusitaniella coriacea TaxID=1983105 RepID=UPI003CE79EC0
MAIPFFSNPTRRWTIVFAIAAAAFATFAVVKYSKEFWVRDKPALSNSIESPQPKATVTALGRLVPQGEMIYLAPTPSVEGSKVAALRVEEGGLVKVGQIVAILDNRDRLQATLEQAKERVNVTRAKLDRVNAGASPREVEAQRAEIARWEVDLREAEAAADATINRLQAQLRNVQTDYQRYQSLYQEGAIAASERDSRNLAVQTARSQLNEAIANRSRTLGTLREQIKEAKATLNRIAEVRPVDVQVAQAEVNDAIAAVRKAEADLELAYVRSPQNGQVLKIHTRPGEIAGNMGIVELGQTDRMEVIAEVYQTDINQVRLGQSATITSDVFPDELRGEVIRIGSQVTQQDIFAAESGSDVDRRIIEVRIRLNPEDSQQVKDFTHLQVQIALN